MLIDCDTCVARPTACADCVVGVLLGTPTVPARDVEPAKPAEPVELTAPAAPGGPLPVEFGPVEMRALEVLADHGLIPHLRLVSPVDEPVERPARRARDAG